jgi:hypothetical protein
MHFDRVARVKKLEEKAQLQEAVLASPTEQMSKLV